MRSIGYSNTFNKRVWLQNAGQMINMLNTAYLWHIRVDFYLTTVRKRG